MSYDLMVFDTAAAPVGRGAFMEWYERQTEWSNGCRYDDPAGTVPGLRSWHMDMIQRFPPMSGPFAIPGLSTAYVADYSVGPHVIYIAFAGSVGMQAYDATFALAQKHRVGFYDVSGDDGSFEPWTPPPP